MQWEAHRRCIPDTAAGCARPRGPAAPDSCPAPMARLIRAGASRAGRQGDASPTPHGGYRDDAGQPRDAGYLTVDRAVAGHAPGHSGLVLWHAREVHPGRSAPVYPSASANGYQAHRVGAARSVGAHSVRASHGGKAGRGQADQVQPEYGRFKIRVGEADDLPGVSATVPGTVSDGVSGAVSGRAEAAFPGQAGAPARPACRRAVRCRAGGAGQGVGVRPGGGRCGHQAPALDRPHRWARRPHRRGHRRPHR